MSFRSTGLDDRVTPGEVAWTRAILPCHLAVIRFRQRQNRSGPPDCVGPDGVHTSLARWPARGLSRRPRRREGEERRKKKKGEAAWRLCLSIVYLFDVGVAFGSQPNAKSSAATTGRFPGSQVPRYPGTQVAPGGGAAALQVYIYVP